jgi:hypothetical protein
MIIRVCFTVALVATLRGDLGRREDRILVAEEDIPYEIQEQLFSINVWVGIIENHLVGPYVLLRHLNGELLEKIPLAIRREIWHLHGGVPPYYVQNAAQEIRQNRDILNRLRLSWTRRALQRILNNFFSVSFYTFTHNYSIFTLLSF